MKMRLKVLTNSLLLVSAFLLSNYNMETAAQSKSRGETKDYLTIDEAIAYPKVKEAVLPLALNPGESPELPGSFRPPYRSVKPIKLFDNLYFVGTTAVGSFIVDTGEGLVMMDAGCGDTDVKMMVDDMKKLGIDPSDIILIFISHEHFDHYGGVQYLKKNICPNALVAMSLTGWNLLQTVPMEWNYIGTRPQSVDIFLFDGEKIKIGNIMFQVIATPGHSPGCLSFIFPIKDNGETHYAGIMGGMAVWPTQTETLLYKTSLEYFSAFAKKAKCDVGLFYHSTEKNFLQIRERKQGDPNLLIIGQENFNQVYMKTYRDKYKEMINSGNLKPY